MMLRAESDSATIWKVKLNDGGKLLFHATACSGIEGRDDDRTAFHLLVEGQPRRLIEVARLESESIAQAKWSRAVTSSELPSRVPKVVLSVCSAFSSDGDELALVTEVAKDSRQWNIVLRTGAELTIYATDWVRSGFWWWRSLLFRIVLPMGSSNVAVPVVTVPGRLIRKSKALYTVSSSSLDMRTHRELSIRASGS